MISYSVSPSAKSLSRSEATVIEYTICLYLGIEISEMIGVSVSGFGW